MGLRRTSRANISRVPNKRGREQSRPLLFFNSVPGITQARSQPYSLLLVEKVRDLLPGIFRVIDGNLGAFFRTLRYVLARICQRGPTIFEGLLGTIGRLDDYRLRSLVYLLDGSLGHLHAVLANFPKGLRSCVRALTGGTHNDFRAFF